MANIVVVSTTNSIKVDFGTYGGTDNSVAGTIPSKQVYRKEHVTFKIQSSIVYALLLDFGLQFPLSYNGAGSTMQVDTVDGASPSSDSDLYDKLIALIA